MSDVSLEKEHLHMFMRSKARLMEGSMQSKLSIYPLSML